MIYSGSTSCWEFRDDRDRRCGSSRSQETRWSWTLNINFSLPMPSDLRLRHRPLLRLQHPSEPMPHLDRASHSKLGMSILIRNFAPLLPSKFSPSLQLTYLAPIRSSAEFCRIATRTLPGLRFCCSLLRSQKYSNWLPWGSSSPSWPELACHRCRPRFFLSRHSSTNVQELELGAVIPEDVLHPFGFDLIAVEPEFLEIGHFDVADFFEIGVSESAVGWANK